MRFLDYLLLERNIINTEAVDYYLGQLMAFHGGPTQLEVGKWVFSNLKNFLLRDYHMVTKLSSAQLRQAILERPWVAKAKNRGDELLNIEIPPAFKNQIEHVMDYFRANPDLNFIRISVPEAIRQSIEWTRQLNKRASKEEDFEGIKEVRKYPDGFKWIEVFSPKALEREGKLMSHCVGSYCDQVSGGTTKIFSLRDKKNEPHCTVEVQYKAIVQMQGKGNGPVDKKYIKYCKDFIMKPLTVPGWSSVEGLNNIGLIELDGNYLEIDKLTASDKEAFIDKIMEYMGSHPVEKGDHRVLGWANDIIEISDVRNSDIGKQGPRGFLTLDNFEIGIFLFGKYSEKIFDEIRKGLGRVTLGTILEYYVMAKRDFGF